MLCFGASQERINMFVVPMVPHLFFHLPSSGLAYAGFSHLRDDMGQNQCLLSSSCGSTSTAATEGFSVQCCSHGATAWGISLQTSSKGLFGKKEMPVLMVGVDALGKSTILYKLKLGDLMTAIPTGVFNGRLWSIRTSASPYRPWVARTRSDLSGAST